MIEGLGTRLYKLFVVFKKLRSCVISTVRFQLRDQCGAYIGSAISVSTHLDSFQEWKLEAITKIGPPSFAEWGAFLSKTRPPIYATVHAVYVRQEVPKNHQRNNRRD